MRTIHIAPNDITLTAAACTSLAASSKLQHLNISCNTFPLGLWRELFKPSSRQLLQLRVLDIARTNFKSIHEDSDLLLTAADAQRLVRCCPGLQHLSAYGTLRDTAALAALSPLSSSLQTLLLAGTGVPWAKLRSVSGIGWAGALAQLTSLEDVDVALEVHGVALECDMPHLTHLRALTRLEIWDGNRQRLECKVRQALGLSQMFAVLHMPCPGALFVALLGVHVACAQASRQVCACAFWLAVQAPGDEPVWHQLWEGCQVSLLYALRGVAI
jgi:hypothetical protein